MTKLEKRVIDDARLVLLGWMGGSIDGGDAMRQALLMLKKSLDALDNRKYKKALAVRIVAPQGERK